MNKKADTEQNTKQCSKCGETKPLSGFRKASGYKDKYRAQCTLCLRAYAKQYGISNQAKRAEQDSIRYWKNRERKPKPSFDPNATSKACTKCAKVKPLDEFTSDARYQDGRRRECKDCKNQQVNAWRAANAEQINALARVRNSTESYKALTRERVRRYKQRHPEKKRADNVLYHARKRARFT
jgi:hypothetical protein